MLNEKENYSLVVSLPFGSNAYYLICFYVQGDANGSCSQLENGYSNSPSLLHSEKAVQELLQQPVQGIDDHLIEFSEAMRSMVTFILESVYNISMELSMLIL